MQRVLVMGCSGAGKSTFARSLADTLGLPFVSIDGLFWRPGWRPPHMPDFTAVMEREAAKPAWVMDGNYLRQGAGELRRANTNAVFWFDLPRAMCMLGVLRRIVTTYGVERPEMAPGCPERVDWEFLRYIWTYRDVQRPKLLTYFAGLRPDQQLITFTTRGAAAAYLASAGAR
jgi:adenylate kinase family enzyme